MGFFEKIKAGLTRTKENIGHSFDQLFAGELNDDFYDELEETLILGDMGVDTTMKAVEELRRRVKAEKIKDMEGARACLRQVLTDMLQVGEPELRLDTAPSVALFIGVNGVGKTTSIGKVAASLKKQGKRVLLVDGEPVKLTATELKIVDLLMRNLGRVFPAEEIYRRVWNEEAYATENTVMVHIRRIREKIELNPKEPEYLKVVWGIGYKIEKR